MTTMRMLKYHDCTGKDFGEDYLRAGCARCPSTSALIRGADSAFFSSSHADFDVLTFLFQREGQDGLEVCAGKEITTPFGVGDVWTPIKVERGAIVINVGDQLKRWSDDRLKRCVYFCTVRASGPHSHG